MFPHSPRIVLGLIGGLLPLTGLAGLVSLGGITPQTAISVAYTNQCIKTLPYSLYEGQSFKISETETPDELGSSREMLNPTNVRIFNPYGALGNTLNNNTFAGLLSAFTYRSNGRPGTSHFNFGGISTILVYKQVDSTYAIKPTPTPTRSTLSSQVVHNLHRRQINSFGSLTNFYPMTYIGPSSTSVVGSFNSNPNDRDSPVNDFECQNFYIAKCGDGVQDNPNKAGTATTDGKDGIIVNGSLIPWSLPSTKPNEACDGTDGVPAGYTCSPTCTLVAIQKPDCTLSVQPGNVTVGTPTSVTWSITGTPTNNPQVTANTATIGGLPFGVNTTPVGSSLIIPQSPGTFLVSLTVSNAGGTSICTAPLTVTVPPLSCALTVSPNPAQAGSPTTVGWIVTGTNFFATSLYVTPNLAGARPHAINANQYIGNTLALLPLNASGSYMFSLTVTNAYTSASCTGILATTPPPPPILHINKTLLNNIPYHSGDQVGFKVEFSNTGSGTAHHVVLDDYLPTSLSYISSSLQGVVPPYTVGTYLSGGVTVVEYSGFDLAPGQSGYMVITGQLISYALCAVNRRNISSISSQELPTLWSSADFICYTPNTNLSIVKTINKSVFSLGENIQFAIIITNNGPDIASNVQIGDLRPNMNCIIPGGSYTSNYPLQTGSNPNATYFRTLIPQLPVGQSLTINLSGTVANTPSCAGSYLNTGTLNYTVNGQIKTGQAYVPFVVNYNNISVSFVKTIVSAGSSHGDAITFALDYKNDGNTTLDSYTIVDYRPSTLSFLSSTIGGVLRLPNSQIPTAGGTLLNRSFPTPLAPNATGRIILNGKIN